MALFVLQNNSYDRIGRLVLPCIEYCNASGGRFEDRSLTADLDVDGWELDDSLGLVIYGSVGWMKRFKASRYSRWVHYDEDTFAATTWVPLLGVKAFNRTGSVLTAEEVGRKLAEGGRLHVRPDRDDKAFAGTLFDEKGWREMLTERSGRLGKDMSSIACWASEPREIDAEIRCWIVDGNLVEASYYRRGGRLDTLRVQDAELLHELSRLGELHVPCCNYVMDIAVYGVSLEVLEYNPIHSSGWYAADVAKILDAWTAAARAAA
jgi:hypothetical protein|nr:ATP-grasp domain-containing protein [Neorhizobium tomejilense]